MTSVKAAPMRSTVNRLGAALLCQLAAVQALAGCTEMSQKNQASMAFVVSAAARPTATPASIRPDAGITEVVQRINVLQSWNTR
jgi:hypothetical protein